MVSEWNFPYFQFSPSSFPLFVERNHSKSSPLADGLKNRNSSPARILFPTARPGEVHFSDPPVFSIFQSDQNVILIVTFGDNSPWQRSYRMLRTQFGC